MKRITLTCPKCGSKAYLRPARVVFGDNAPNPEDKFYVCGRYPACDCYVSAHRRTLRPMGTLADRSLRKKRQETHRALDKLWQSGLMSRAQAYRLICLYLGLPEGEAHIAAFSLERCEDVIAFCGQFYRSAARAA